MPEYKKIIFKKAIRLRLEKGEGSIDEIINSYTKLTIPEKNELRSLFVHQK